METNTQTHTDTDTEQRSVKKRRIEFCGFDIIPIEITTIIITSTGDFKAIAAQCCRQWRHIILSHHNNDTAPKLFAR